MNVMKMNVTKRLLSLSFVVVAAIAASTTAFSPLSTPCTARKFATRLQFGEDKSSSDETKKPKNLWEDMKGMFTNFDDVVDDFFYKRMGAGEQWYGKRKYNPSGRLDGDYNGMGMSDHFRIEIARVRKEELELKRQRRLAAEEEKRRNS